MISYEIPRKNKPQTLVQSIKQRILSGSPPPILNADKLDNQHKLAEGEKPEPLPPRFTRPSDSTLWVPEAQRTKSSFETTAMVWGKLRYLQWMSRLVVPKFPVGCLVTLRSEPFVPGIAPKQFWEVIEHQEIHYMANMDKDVQEPKCLGLWKHGTQRIPTYYPPAKLRALQPEEVKAIDILRTQEKSGASQNVTSGGVDPSGGTGSIGEESPREEGDI